MKLWLVDEGGGWADRNIRIVRAASAEQAIVLAGRGNAIESIIELSVNGGPAILWEHRDLAPDSVRDDD